MGPSVAFRAAVIHQTVAGTVGNTASASHAQTASILVATQHGWGHRCRRAWSQQLERAVSFTAEVCARLLTKPKRQVSHSAIDVSVAGSSVRARCVPGAVHPCHTRPLS